MNNLKGSRTEANLYASFAGESQAFMKYTLYAEQAKKDGYVKVEKEFTKIAQNEKAHAELYLKHIHGGNIPKTERNIEDSANGEHYEWSEVYSGFAKVAKDEGFTDLANIFEGVAKVEQGHDKKFTELLTEVQNGNIFKSQQEEVWECLNCGHHHQGMQPPGVCPVCEHPQSYFKKVEKKQEQGQ